jgi:hypothetical protein
MLMNLGQRDKPQQAKSFYLRYRALYLRRPTMTDEQLDAALALMERRSDPALLRSAPLRFPPLRSARLGFAPLRLAPLR